MVRTPSSGLGQTGRARASSRGGGVSLRLSLLSLGLLVFAGGCATKSDLRGVEDQIRELQDRQDEVLDQLVEASQASQDTLRGQSELITGVRGQVSEDLRRMEGQLNTLTIAMQESARIQQRILEELGEMERRLTALSAMASALPRDSTGGGAPQQDPGEAEAIYEEARNMASRGSLGTARGALEQFISAYPNHRLAPDAYFLLGDVLVQEEEFDDAIEAFLKVPELYPAATVVPDALYRAGLTSVEVGRADDARRYLQRVVNSYPESDAATLAQEVLDQIG